MSQMTMTAFNFHWKSDNPMGMKHSSIAVT